MAISAPISIPRSSPVVQMAARISCRSPGNTMKNTGYLWLVLVNGRWITFFHFIYGMSGMSSFPTNEVHHFSEGFLSNPQPVMVRVFEVINIYKPITRQLNPITHYPKSHYNLWHPIVGTIPPYHNPNGYVELWHQLVYHGSIVNMNHHIPSGKHTKSYWK